MPIEPELGITAPCKLRCTLVALFTSYISGMKEILVSTINLKQEQYRPDESIISIAKFLHMWKKESLLQIQ